MEGELQLYTFFRSSAAYRVRIALNIKGLHYRSISKALAKGEQLQADYLAINAQGLVPALVVQDTVLTQSLAIIEYLDEEYPTPPLLPRDPIGRAQVRAIALAIACDIHPLNNLRVLNYLRREFKQDDEGVNAWYRHWIAEGFRALEQWAQKYSTDGRYCFGDSVSLADVLLVPQMFNARRFHTDLAPYRKLVQICGHLEALPEFAAARPEAQPDAQQ
ncbi:MAG TPA: maleylacetoacetate isomerase [Steroidobacteraceae bacterium]|nr:maleylacetoacetate isomerase [Steroidobacteraceae bacterium]